MNQYSIQYILNQKDKELLGKEISLSAWVRTKRGNKHVAFIALNDGSCMANLQVVADMTQFTEEDLKDVTTGSSINVIGTLVESQGKGQSFEIQAKTVKVLGVADAETYPLQKKGHSLEFLREIAHLRPRTNTFGAVFRIRHHMSFAIHKFFNDEGFFNLHTPIITASDAEGAGEMFRVSTFEPNNAPTNPDGSIDYTKDFFGRETNLTVSGQLEGELGALALGKIYTFGPTFRAENSNTTRHLAEFWMIEPEMAFYQLQDNMDLAEKMLTYLIKYALTHCKEDIEFLNSMYDNTLIERLQHVSTTPFVRITYTEAVEILQKSGKKFEYKVEWGTDLQSEHERYLVEQHFKKPVILTHYPKHIKAFYMKQAEDGKTVKAMDILFPGIGEIVGGSERENDLDALLTRMKELGIHEEDIWWYLDTRKFGSVPHSGFGLGFERLLLFITGMQNIRDVIPFPRFPKFADF
jgi:asparaginyl-tRNA synthetase